MPIKLRVLGGVLGFSGKGGVEVPILFLWARGCFQVLWIVATSLCLRLLRPMCEFQTIICQAHIRFALGERQSVRGLSLRFYGSVHTKKFMETLSY